MNAQFIAAGVLVLALAAAGVADERSNFHGQVVSANGGQLAIQSGGEIVRFSFTDDAEITLDGQPAMLDDLTPDHVADVSARRVGDDWVALKVEARSQKIVGRGAALHRGPPVGGPSN